MSSKIAMLLAVVGMMGAADVEGVRVNGWMGISENNQKTEEANALLTMEQRKTALAAKLGRGPKPAAARAPATSSSALPAEFNIPAPVFTRSTMPPSPPSPPLPPADELKKKLTLDEAFAEDVEVPAAPVVEVVAAPAPVEVVAPAPVAPAVARAPVAPKSPVTMRMNSSMSAAEAAKKDVMDASRARKGTGKFAYTALVERAASPTTAPAAPVVVKAASPKPMRAASPVKKALGGSAFKLSLPSKSSVTSGVFGTRGAVRAPLLDLKLNTNSSRADQDSDDEEDDGELIAASRTSTIQSLKKSGNFTSLRDRAALFGGKPVDIERTTTFGRGTTRGGVAAMKTQLLNANK